MSHMSLSDADVVSNVHRMLPCCGSCMLIDLELVRIRVVEVPIANQGSDWQMAKAQQGRIFIFYSILLKFVNN